MNRDVVIGNFQVHIYPKERLNDESIPKDLEIPAWIEKDKSEFTFVKFLLNDNEIIKPNYTVVTKLMILNTRMVSLYLTSDIEPKKFFLGLREDPIGEAICIDFDFF